MKRSLLLSATALLGVVLSANAEMKDITPEGYDFSTYENKANFPMYGGNDGSDATALVNASPWTYRDRHSDAFTTNKQLTTFIQRGVDKSTDAWAEYYKTYFTVTELCNYKTKYSYGKCLVINMPYAMLGSASIVPPAKINNSYVSFHSNYLQFNFYLDPTKIENFTAGTPHYVRVRIVYNVLNKGREYLYFNENNVRNMDYWATWTWGTADDGTIIPDGDADAAYPNSDDENGRKKDNAKWGDDFALWKGMEFDAYSGVEGAVYDVNKIANEHEIYYAQGLEQSQLDCYDMWITSSSYKIDEPHYIQNCDRWMVYEFDMPVDAAHGTAMATMNMRANCYTNYMIKEIKFFDLGTNAEDATYLGKRNITYRYLAEGAINDYTDESGVKDIIEEVADTDAPAVYYNFQGMEVKNPANGLYIVKRGNKVSKEYVR